MARNLQNSASNCRAESFVQSPIIWFHIPNSTKVIKTGDNAPILALDQDFSYRFSALPRGRFKGKRGGSRDQFASVILLRIRKYPFNGAGFHDFSCAHDHYPLT